MPDAQELKRRIWTYLEDWGWKFEGGFVKNGEANRRMFKVDLKKAIEMVASDVAN
jgi:hypothetical protein